MKKIFGIALVGIASLANAEFDVVLSTDCAVSASDFSYDSLKVQINGAAVTIDGAHQFASLGLVNGATITHSACTESTSSSLDINVGGCLSLDADSEINVDGRGYIRGRTAGNSTAKASKRRSGGSYGGEGGDYMGDAGEAYGVIHNPDEPGSGAGPDSRGGAGGGLVLISAGELVLEGNISADGQDGRDWGGGGAGGGICIRADVIRGSGSISANGGGVASNGRAGGGGGRVAVFYGDLDGFSVSNRVTASGGSGTYAGSAGSVFLKPDGKPAILIWDNRGINSDKSTRFHPSEYDTRDASLVAKGKARLEVLMGQLAVSNLTVSESSILTHPPTTTDEEFLLEIGAMGCVSIDSSSLVDVSARGYLQDYTIGNTTTGGSSGRSGGSYGGLGGAYTGEPNATYGDALNPCEPGSGAGESSSGGSGGGLVRITARELLLDGGIRADAKDGSSHGGGGSGGAIYVDALTFSGDGILSADGGDSGSSYSGAGGGGRIAVYSEYGWEGDQPVRISVSAGAGAGSPSDGSIAAFSNSAPLRIKELYPSGYVSDAVSNILVSFCSPLASSSGDADVTLTGPQGDVAVEMLVPNPFYWLLDIAAVDVAEGEYTLVIGTNVSTINGGVLEYPLTNRFVIDLTAPNAPSITGVLGPPATNNSTNALVTLHGTRDDFTSVWIGNSEIVTNGSGFWSCQIVLEEGENHLSVFCTDLAGNSSPTSSAVFVVDSVAPEIISEFPADGCVTNGDIAEVGVFFEELTSGLDGVRSQVTLARLGVDVPGQIVAETNYISFVSSGALLDGSYCAQILLFDNSGHSSPLYEFSFEIDRLPPPAPQVEAVLSPTTIDHQLLRGTKEAGSSIMMNGIEVVAPSGSTNWQEDVSLSKGKNELLFSAVDSAGNESAKTNVLLIFDDTVPGPITNLVVSEEGTGMDVGLSWPLYCEESNGSDIALYKVYRSDNFFTNIAGAEFLLAEEAGTQTCQITGLVRSVTSFYAVVPVDSGGLSSAIVISKAAAPVDVLPPDNPSSLVFGCSHADLSLSWGQAADAHDDLAGYRVYMPGDTFVGETSVGEHSYLMTGLTPASAYEFRIVSFDNDGNESSGIEGTGHTLLVNPSDLSVDPYDKMITVMWSPVTPSDYLSCYGVYVSDVPATNVLDMTRKMTVTATNATVVGLVNGVTNYIAVSTVNKSGGENTAVTTVAAVAKPDTEGPVIGDIHWNGGLSGTNITSPGTWSVEVTDPAGVDEVSFQLDGNDRFTAGGPGPVYTLHWDVRQVTDGIHFLTVSATDAADNSSQVTTGVVVRLAVPGVPLITDPQNGDEFNSLTVPVSLQADDVTESVGFSVNSKPAGLWTAISDSGGLTANVGLVEGTNTLSVIATNRAGQSGLSDTIILTVDTSIPDPPLNLAASSREGGVIRLSWIRPQLGKVSGYNVYRSSSPFTKAEGAELVFQTTAASTVHSDLPSGDGTYYYSVSTVNSVGTESDLSDQVIGVSDSVAPHVVGIDYASAGTFDGDRYGPGRIDFTMTVSEHLITTPFLSFVRSGGSPMTMSLVAESELTYTGEFEITTNMGSGITYAGFSGRDAAGNRGTDILSGDIMVVDTDGPVAENLVLYPSTPILNNPSNPVTVTAVLSFKTDDVPVETPTLTYDLSLSQTGIADVALAPHTEASWVGTFVLPANAGFQTEKLSFQYHGRDSLGNSGHTIAENHSFQVYQGELPPLDVPTNLEGQVLPAGEITLSWGAVEGAAGYAVYRELSGETGFVQVAETVGSANYSEIAPDGSNTYAVASIRRANGQEAKSVMSDSVLVVADSLAPVPPANLAISLAGHGLVLSWDPPSNDSDLAYSVYRATEPVTTTSIQNLDVLIDGVTATEAVDGTPLQRQVYYAVTAVDNAGNRSLPSDSVYTNISLLPVSSLEVVKQEGALPSISWSHTATDSISGFNFYVGPNGEELLVNDEILDSSTLSLVDTGYDSRDRYYKVSAVDLAGTNSAESVTRSVVLPFLGVESIGGENINRGVMNRLEYLVRNMGETDVSNVTLETTVSGISHVSDVFRLNRGDSNQVSVVVGGYSDLAGVVTTTNTLVSTLDGGETALIVSSRQINVGQDTFTSEIRNTELVRGGEGSVRLVLHNTCDVDIEVVTARDFGSENSDEVSVQLEDTDGFVLAVGGLLQNTGDNVITLADGTTVARIPPGKSFTSDEISIAVPASTPIDVVLRLGIQSIHYNYGRENHVCIDGLISTRELAVTDTDYFAVATNCTPSSSTGDSPVLISGHTCSRQSGSREPNVLVFLTVCQNGFERVYELTSDSNGEWSYLFAPEDQESGYYTVWASHPDISDKPIECTFTISKVLLSPSVLHLAAPRNYEQSASVTATASTGLTLTNLQFSYVADDQPEGALGTGVHVTTGAPVGLLAGGESVGLPFSMWFDNAANSNGCLALRATSDGAPDESWGHVLIDYTLSEAEPSLYWDPNYVQIGMALSNTATATVTIENNGLAELEDVCLSLVTTNNNPAPDWVILNAAESLGDIAKGDHRSVSMAFAPREQALIGMHEFRLRITSANYRTKDVNVFVAVDASGKGDVIFKVIDLYYGYDNGDGANTGVGNARIGLQKQDGSGLSTNVTTDAMGEAWLRDLPVGVYNYKVDSDAHQSLSGTLEIQPGVTATEEIFLASELVTIEWSVVPSTIEDSYEIVLEATFETDVPAAVVLASPMSVTMPDMDAGDVLNGEFELKNHGLVRADSVQAVLPPGDDYFRFELMCDPPGTIDAASSVTLPYRITCLSPLNAGPGGSEIYAGTVGFSYETVCLGGSVVDDSAQFYYMGSTDSDTEPVIWGYAPGEGTLNGGGPGEYFSAVSSGTGTQLDGSGCEISVGVTVSDPNMCVGCTSIVSVAVGGCIDGGCPSNYVVALSCDPSARLSQNTVVVGVGMEETVELVAVTASAQEDADKVVATSGGKTAETPYTVVELEDLVIEPQIGIGDSSRPKVEIMPAAWPVTWSISDRYCSGGELKIEIDPSNGRITVDKESGAGWIVVRVEADDVGCGEGCWIEKKVSIGCGRCSSCDMALGNANLAVSSIHSEFFLGQATEDESAGRLYIYAEGISDALATPTALRFGAASDDHVLVESDHGVPRQVVVPQGMADVVVLSDESYEIRYYYPSQVGAINGEGLFPVEGEPFTVWRIEDPGISEDGSECLRMTKTINGHAITNLYSWNSASATWTLSKGNALVIETKQTSGSGDDWRTVISEVSDVAGSLSSRTVETRRDFPWGEEVTKRVVATGSENLVATFTYCDDPEQEGSYRRLVYQENPDGSWVTNSYNSSGTLFMRGEGWKDLPAGSPVMQGQVSWYQYSPVDPMDTGTAKPAAFRAVTKTIAGTTVSKSYRAYIEADDGGMTEIEEICAGRVASYGDARNLRTVRCYYPTVEPSVAESGKLASVLLPDGRRDSYGYFYGTYIEDEDPSKCVFVEGTGASVMMTITHGTRDRHEGIPWKSTKEVIVTDPQGNPVIEETYVVSDGGAELIAREVRYFNDLGRQVRVVHSDGTITESRWACCGTEGETDRYGVERTFVRDDLARLTGEIKHGVGEGAYQAQGDIAVSYSLDSSGRRLSVESSDGSLKTRSESLYDLAGRLTNHVNAAGLVTSYRYTDGGRTETVMNPAGLERVTETYLSGQTKNVTENGVLRESYDYGVNPDGTRWVQVWKGQAGSNSLSWARTVTDSAGRTVRMEKPGYSVMGSVVLTNSYVYNDWGQLEATTVSGMPDTLYEYGELGDTKRTGLDLDGDGKLESFGRDRITAQESSYGKDEAGDWWAQTASSVYSSTNDTAITNQTQLTRLTGFNSGKISEVVTIGVYGNETRSIASVDSATKTLTQTVSYPDSTNNAVKVTVNGLVVSSESRSGIKYVYGNDGLGRRLSVTDPRTGTRITHFNDKGQVDYVLDSLSNRTSYAYHAGTGHLIGITNAVGETAWHEYGTNGQLLARWGDAVYPVRYEYGEEGQVAAMYTLRDTSVIISNYASFIENEEFFDRTSWLYDDATGLLTNKVYADGKGVSYTYTPEGKLKGRMWARGQVPPAEGQVPAEWEGLDRVITTYAYTNTGELVGIGYSDGTPGVSMTLDHLGRHKTITDAQGTREFHYSPEGQLTNETLGTITIARTHDSHGRAYTLSVDPNSGSDHPHPYQIAYGQDPLGRLNSLESVIFGITNAYSYKYTPNSDMVAEVGVPEVGFRARKDYEPQRDLISEVLNQYGEDIISRYNYRNDPIGRRTSRTDLSPDSPVAITNIFAYNPRSEVTNAIVPVPDNAPVPASTNTYGYDYDNIGNRKSSVAPDSDRAYLANELNQYTETAENASTNVLLYDSDGNLTNDGVRVYTWNAENRLKTISPVAPGANDIKLTFGYDYMGRRFSKVISTHDGSAWQITCTNTFVYDGWNMVAELTQSQTHTLTNFYTWGLDLSGSPQGAGGIGGLLSVTRNTTPAPQTLLYCFDANGNVMQLVVAEDGSLKSQYHYTPFGNTIPVGDPQQDPNPFRFSTKYFDKEVEQYDYGRRCYIPASGRWLSRDRISERGGQNIYGFVLNSPFLLVDPDGRAPQYVHQDVSVTMDLMSMEQSYVHSGDIDFGDWSYDMFAPWQPASPSFSVAYLDPFAIPKAGWAAIQSAYYAAQRKGVYEDYVELADWFYETSAKECANDRRSKQPYVQIGRGDPEVRIAKLKRPNVSKWAEVGLTALSAATSGQVPIGLSAELEEFETYSRTPYPDWEKPNSGASTTYSKRNPYVRTMDAGGAAAGNAFQMAGAAGTVLLEANKFGETYVFLDVRCNCWFAVLSKFDKKSSSTAKGVIATWYKQLGLNVPVQLNRGNQ